MLGNIEFEFLSEFYYFLKLQEKIDNYFIKNFLINTLCLCLGANMACLLKHITLLYGKIDVQKCSAENTLEFTRLESITSVNYRWPRYC